MAEAYHEGVLKRDFQLFERILAIDFYADLHKEESPNLEHIRNRIKWHEPLQELPVLIPDVNAYHRHFFPLYMIECLHMLGSHKYKSMNYPTKVDLVAYTTEGVYATIVFSSAEDMPFSSGDIVLLYVGALGHHVVPQTDTAMKYQSLDDELSDESVTRVSAPPDHPMFEDNIRHALGYVLSSQNKKCAVMILIMPPSYAIMDIFDNRSLDRLETLQELLQLSYSSPGLVINKDVELPAGETWYISRILSFSTALREYNALFMMEYMPLKNKLLNKYEKVKDDVPDSSEREGYLSKFNIPKKLRKSLESSFNIAQLRAIKDSLKKEGITLIQGPPGTGKTTTIMGILSAIMESDNLYNDVDSSDMDRNCYNGNAASRTPWFQDSDLSDSSMEICFDELNETESIFDLKNHRYDSYACISNKIHENPEVIRVSVGNHRNRRILICAPSNAAIDEIVKRLVRPVNGGIFNAQGEKYNPKVTRIGRNFHDDIKMYSLKYKVDRLAKLRCPPKNVNASPYLRSAIAYDILLESDIVCSTLSACGSNELSSCTNMFDTLIVDEATQAVELSTLIALCLGCRRVILVGDPCQLSATVCSNVAVSLNYDRSLFQRLQMCGYPVNLLNVQYRMDPLISRFPSMYFYKNQLKDAPNVYNRETEDWREFPLLRPTVFYALNSQQSIYETSYQNEMEADIVCQLLEIMLEVLSTEPGFQLSSLQQRIAVITTYSAQVLLLKETIAKRFTQLVLPPAEKDPQNPKVSTVPRLLIDVSSVDGFQGMEKEIVIFSAVRTSYVGSRKVIYKSIRELTPSSVLTIDQEPHDPEDEKRFHKVSEDYLRGISSGKISSYNQDVVDVSFIADRRRINVAITRAVRNLFIVGNPRFLLDHIHWHALYNHYAQCGYTFICNMNQCSLNKNYLKMWAKEYLMKNPGAYDKFLQNPYLEKFVSSLMRS
ncbi:DNA2/NAM7-like helicase [Babesia gibsoni]|uniref:DNA2/NAM7-like helicase n=1 Tax=Babesia gibsoni TaxID=33632 RepID=A0AAD8PFP4_BABGI|nr:DNA2/NAM7-like helicase [Babesia gibsoni]